MLPFLFFLGIFNYADGADHILDENKTLLVTPTPIYTPISPTINVSKASPSSHIVSTFRGLYDVTASFYDDVQLAPTSFILSRPYMKNAIDFDLRCYDEVWPYPSCKFTPELSSGVTYSIRWAGKLWVPSSGAYTFMLSNVDDGMRLQIDGEHIVDKGWNYPAPDQSSTPQTILLSKGQHAISIDYEQRPRYIASAQLCWSGPEFTDEMIPINHHSFQVDSIRIIPEESLETASIKDFISFNTFDIEIIGSGPIPPNAVATTITALTTDRVTEMDIAYIRSLGTSYIYKTNNIDISTIVNYPSALSASVLAYDEDKVDFEVAERTLGYLRLPKERQLGTAWAIGANENTDRIPQASRLFMQSAGFENIEVAITLDIPSSALPAYSFVKNQAKVFFYFGHGLHNDNYLFIQPTEKAATPFYPDAIENHWLDVDIAMLFGCSVLEIGDYNNWWDESECPTPPDELPLLSPGLAWIDNPGPEIWLGFQDTAPSIGENAGEDAIYMWATSYARHGMKPIVAWQQATQNTSKFRAAVAVDKENYYFWKEWCLFGQKPCRDAWGKFCVKHVATYRWMRVPLSQARSGQVGLNAFVVPAAARTLDMNIYDSENRQLGSNYDNRRDVQIPNAIFSQQELTSDSNIKTSLASIYDASSTKTYTLTLTGRANDTLNLFVEIPDCQERALYHATFITIPITADTTFILPLNTKDFSLIANNDMKIAPTALWTSPLSLSSCQQ